MTYSEYMLTARWMKPKWTKQQVISRHHCPSMMVAAEQCPFLKHDPVVALAGGFQIRVRGHALRHRQGQAAEEPDDVRREQHLRDGRVHRPQQGVVHRLAAIPGRGAAVRQRKMVGSDVSRRAGEAVAELGHRIRRVDDLACRPA